MREPQEIEDEEHEQLVERVAAVDVAKAAGALCTRDCLPSPDLGRRGVPLPELVRGVDH